MLETQLEKYIQQLSTHPLFLKSVATFLNFNSYRKLVIKKVLEGALKELELPIRRDQEKMMAMIQELEIRIKQMQQQQKKTTQAAKPSQALKVEIDKASSKISATEKLNKMTENLI